MAELYPIIAKGVKLGAHCIEGGGVENYAAQLMANGAFLSVVKAVDSFGYLRLVKAVSPETLTLARVSLPIELEGCGGLMKQGADLQALAKKLVEAVISRIAREPWLRDCVDYWEVVNEADPEGPEGYCKLSELMTYCMAEAEKHDLKLALFSLNSGTPEWDEMVALVDTGVFGIARDGGHILALHEGPQSKRDLVDLYWNMHNVDAAGSPTTEDTGKTCAGGWIPGSPVIPDAGALHFRYRFLYHLLEQRGEAIPLVITEWYYGAGYEKHGATPRQVVEAYSWWSEKAAKDWYMLGACPFTIGPVGRWKTNRVDFGFAYPALVAWAAQMKDSPCATQESQLPPEEPEPEGEMPDAPKVNLLINGDFETEWQAERSHRCLVFPVRGEAYIAERGNIFTPPGWITWFGHGKPVAHDPQNQVGWSQPEVRDSRSFGPNRMHSGAKGTLLFSFFRIHDAGLMQKVTVPRGARLKLTAQAHAWSNSKDGPNADVPGWSEGAGFGAFDKVVGETQDEAERNFTFWVGIDPTGGTDPFADTVVWGEGRHIYNVFAELAVVAEAESAEVTVFLRSRALWPFKHNDAYWDDACLVIDVEPAMPVPGRGRPRVQYRRDVVLLPPGADKLEFVLAALAVSTTGGTLLCSADDAGIGDLDERVVRAVNPDLWEGDLAGFFATYYPGVQLIPVEAATPFEMAVRLLPGVEPGDYALNQKDPRWGAAPLGRFETGWTIGQRGCMLTNLCMILRKHCRVNITPPMLNSILAQSDIAFIGDDILDWMSTTALFPGVFAERMRDDGRYTLAQLEVRRGEGWELVLRVADGAHFVLYAGTDDEGRVWAIDPLSGLRISQWTIGDVSGVRGVRIPETLMPVPEPQPEPAPVAENQIVGVHGNPSTHVPSVARQSALIKEMQAMGVKWYKMVADGSRDSVGFAGRLVEAGIKPVVRLYAAQQWPGRLPASLLASVPEYVQAGVEYFEQGNEPNLTAEWPRGYLETLDWHKRGLVEAVCASAWADALAIIEHGGRAAYPLAMAPTDNGAQNPRYSSLAWQSGMLDWLREKHERAGCDLYCTEQLWVAVHSAAFNRRFEHTGLCDDMCLRGYEDVLRQLRRWVGLNPVAIATEGGCYSPEHLRFLGEHWANPLPYDEAGWGEAVAEMYDYLAQLSGTYGGLTAMCSWTLTDEGVDDPRWWGSGWFDREGHPRSPVAALKKRAST
jgi:hypothetical protein